MVRWVVGSIPHGVFVCCCFVVFLSVYGARCSSVVRGSAHGEMGRRIDTSWCVCLLLFCCFFVCLWSKMWLRGKRIRSWCDGSSDRYLMVYLFVVVLLFFLSVYGARCSSVVRGSAHGGWVVGSIPHGVFVCCCFLFFCLFMEQDVAPW